MRVDTRAFHQAFDNCQTINCTRENARKIVSHFVTKGYWFHFFESENECYLTFSNSMDLDRLRARIEAPFEIDA